MPKATRDLANSNESVINELISYGSKSKKEYILNHIIPRKLADRHINRNYWIHDLEFYDTTYNCLGLRVSDLIGSSKLSLFTACRRLYREIITLTNEQSGGIGFINFDEDMSYYITNETDEEIAEQIKELFHDLNVYVRKGCEKAYITLNFGLDTTENGRRFNKIMLKQYSLGDSDGKPFIFPNLVFKMKSAINSEIGSFNYDIFEQSCETTARCMIPTYFNCDSTINENIDPSLIGIMGCRTRVADNLFGNSTSLNRGNIASVTINLIQIALESNNEINVFKHKLSEIMEDSKKLLLNRFNVLCNSSNLTYLKENALYLNSDKEFNTDMFKNGTLSIGFIGLWDDLSILVNNEITGDYILSEHNNLAYEIVSFMRNKVDQFLREKNLNFSLLASSAEGVCGNFPKYDKVKYKNYNHIIDKDYYTNSFHVPVSTDISCFEKIIAESSFHKLCNGGAITYIELNEIPNENVGAIKDLIHFAKNEDCSYFGINFPLDQCCECGYIGEINQNCPNCSSDKILKLRRVSGYLSDVNNFTNGKFAELDDRKPNIS